MFHVTVVLYAHECSLESTAARYSRIDYIITPLKLPEHYVDILRLYHNTRYSILSPLQILIEPNQTRHTATGPVWARDWRDRNMPESST